MPTNAVCSVSPMSIYNLLGDDTSKAERQILKAAFLWDSVLEPARSGQFHPELLLQVWHRINTKSAFVDTEKL